MKFKNVLVILLGFYWLLCPDSSGCEETNIPIKIKDPYFFNIGNCLHEEKQDAFKQCLSGTFTGNHKKLFRKMQREKLHLVKKYVIYDQLPGYAFYKITPAHMMALINGYSGGLKVFDAGCGDGYWSIMMASQGNKVVSIDTFPINILYNLQHLKSLGFGDVADAVDVYEGDFVPSLKSIHREKQYDFDMIVSFNSLHFLTPSRVDAFLCTSFNSLQKGGKLIGIANSPYNYEVTARANAPQALIARNAEDRQDKNDRFPGYVEYSAPAEFFETEETILRIDLLNHPSYKLKISVPQGEKYPNVSYCSKQLHLSKGESYVDISATMVAHSFFRETIENGLYRAGFTIVSTFYIDEDSNTILQNCDFKQDKLEHRRKLLVGFCATK